MPTLTSGALIRDSKSDPLQSISFSALIPALCFALDLTEDRPMGHVLRTCIIGMHIGNKIHLAPDQLTNLFRTLLLKDVGCSNGTYRSSEMSISRRANRSFSLLRRKRGGSNGSRTETASPWRSYETAEAETSPQFRRFENKSELALASITKYRCERASRISYDLGLPIEVTEALYEVDERWDGSGYPNGLKGEQISILSRIISIAQTLDIAAVRFGRATAIDVVSRRCGTWFDRGLVVASNFLHDRSELWEDLDSTDLISRVKALEPSHPGMTKNSFDVDNICMAFADVVDAKSPFTFTLSTGVAKFAASMARLMGQDQNDIRLIHRAALLHDIGKLGVPRLILEKPGHLSPDEWNQVYDHPRNTKQILDKIPGFEDIAYIAALHHEKLDASGYPYGLDGSQLPLLARILTAADIYDALTSLRPYRDPLTREQALEIMRKEAPHALDPLCLESLSIATEED
jgi:HD-GYP domain-containing protein (c-di-GMP phosphodiesterase class II)